MTLLNQFSDALAQHVDLLSDAFRLVRTERSFTIDAIVILPKLLHTILTLPIRGVDYSGRWRAIKSRFTHAQRRYLNHPSFERQVDSLIKCSLTGTYNAHTICAL
ncbi:MAG: hypothetical protein WCH01_21160 [Methylococcaceae bacterium]